MLFFVADDRAVVNKVLGAVRSRLGDMLGLKDPNLLALVWITDFPFYEMDEKNGKLDFGHNPFQCPKVVWLLLILMIHLLSNHISMI